MNRNNKFAKGAVRERKARKERAHEQDKPKRCKRWQRRLLALFGCLLLVSALVVPCFADSPTPPDYSDEWRVRWDRLLADIHDVYEDRHNNPSFFYMIDYAAGWFDFFNYGSYEVFVSDFLVLGVNYADIDAVLGEGGGLLNEMDVDVFWSFPGEGDVHDDGGSFTIQISLDESDYLEIEVYDKATLTYYVSLSYLYSDRDDLCELQRVSVREFNQGEPYYQVWAKEPQGDELDLNDYNDYNFSISIGFTKGTDLRFAAQFFQVLYGEEGYIVSYPTVEYGAISEGFADARALGSTLVNRAFQAGYDLSEGGYDTGYQEGFTEALNQVGSDEFGRNFLKSVFSTPFEILQNFTLVSWQKADGSMVEITLLTLFSACVGLSLFVWFLKTFAGG